MNFERRDFTLNFSRVIEHFGLTHNQALAVYTPGMNGKQIAEALERAERENAQRAVTNHDQAPA